MSLTATFQTSKGPIHVRLFDDKAPLTVANFVNLAQRGFYDGLNFHRVIADFMIQGGCPLGTGTGGPGYQFEDEFVPGLSFDKPGKLAMANAGPATNGSQFFITVAPTEYLTGRHTIFGEVV
ncbi:MAG: peptidylprolyl isomerase, partial [Xanthomonadaceae bacterium]|nr:peptidylprolyl isomerase [Xanthomonadaceae bacterium]